MLEKQLTNQSCLREPTPSKTLGGVCTRIVALVITLFATTTEIQAGFLVKDLGGLRSAQGINEAGHAVGYSYQSFASVQAGNSVRNLGTLGGQYSYGFGINDAGFTTGQSRTSNNRNRGFIHDGNTMREIGTFGGRDSSGTDINNSGVATGWAGDNSNYRLAFTFDGHSLRSLGTLGGRDSYGAAINDAGFVTGFSRDASNRTRAFLHDGNSMQDLGTLGGTYSYGQGINNLGMVTGYAENGNHRSHAFLHDGTVMRDLGTLGGTFSNGLGVNDLGQVVGTSTTVTHQHRAFLYQNNVMLDLNSMIDPSSGWFLEQAYAINNHGQIVGYGTHNGQGRAFLLTADTTSLNTVPEPSSLASLGLLALVGVGLSRRRTAVN